MTQEGPAANGKLRDVPQIGRILPITSLHDNDQQPLLALPYRKEPAVIRVKVTPAIAQRWLELNRRNRALRPRVVRHYASQMKENRWVLNGECIKFSARGVLIDGQHRLHAVVEADVAIDFDVHVGLSDDAVFTIDTGALRTGADVLTMRNLSQGDARVLAGAVQLLINHERHRSMWAIERASNREIDEYFGTHQTLYLSLDAIRSAGGTHSRLYPGALAVALHSLFTVRDRQAAHTFFDRLYRGLNLSDTDPLYWLRRYCESPPTTQGRHTRYYELAVRTTKCWNLTRAGTTVKQPSMLAPRKEDFVLPEVK
ncbi:hypothetical protein AAB992_14130 [Burkholderia contaminans]|uniref:hypothetical protein n=1 Tax=Burkholderia contaminans TaxID=488447 RepID=UPI0024175910|nr:hypothetical protein [Burkholderia contaminans]WFN14388.1 hypothetical protein LXE92_36385 [Burkholderia contaminans]